MSCCLDDPWLVPRVGSPGLARDFQAPATCPEPGLCFLTPSSLRSPDGYLYEREAILEYILHQKKEIARQMKVQGLGGGGARWRRGFRCWASG